MEKVEEFEFEDVFRKNIVLVGTSTAGKTTIAKSILKPLAGHMAKAYVFCPTDKTHGDYSTNMFPTNCVFDKVDPVKVEGIINTQMTIAALKNASYDYEQTGAIIRKYIPNGEQIMNKLDTKYPVDLVSKQKEYTKMVLTKVMRPLLRKLRDDEETRVDGKTKRICELMDVNVDLLLLFDDATEGVKALAKTKKNGNYHYFLEFMNILRHNRTTMVLLLHSLRNIIPPDYRKEGIHLLIYVEYNAAITLLKEMGFKMSEIRQMMPSTEENKKYWKLAYVKNWGRYIHYRANIKKLDKIFRVPSDAWFERCDQVKKLF